MIQTTVSFNNEKGDYERVLLSDLSAYHNPFKAYQTMTKLSFDALKEPLVLRLFALALLNKCSDLRDFSKICDASVQKECETMGTIMRRGQYDAKDLENLKSLYMSVYKKKLIMKKQIERELADAGNLHTLDEARKNKDVMEKAFATYHDLCFVEALLECLIIICENQYEKKTLEAKVESLRNLLRDYYSFYETCYKGMKERITTSVDYQATPLYFLSDHITSALTHSFFKTKHYKKDLEKTKSVDEQLKALKAYEELNIHDYINLLEKLESLEEKPITLYIDAQFVYLPKDF